VRFLPAAVTISAALHAALLPWVYAHRTSSPVALSGSPVTPAIEVDAVPVTITFLDPTAEATAPPSHTRASAPPTAPAPTGGASNRARTGDLRISTETSGTETAAPTTGRSAPMTMRHPQISTGVSAEWLQHFLDDAKPLEPNPIEGERIAEDIAQDRATLANPRWIANASPGDVFAQYQKLVADREAAEAHELKHDGTGYKAEHRGYDAHVDSTGSVTFKDKPGDATDWLMRTHGIDPYASDKLRMLDETREERYQIGKRTKHEQLMRSAQLALNNVDFLWAKTTDLAERKEGLFELWDECAETGDDDLVEGGKQARLLILGVIRSRLTGSASYTRDELAALNERKRSHAVFAPYED
jgi:hypothetical protein